MILVVKNFNGVSRLFLNKNKTEYEVNVELKSLIIISLVLRSNAFCGPVRFFLFYKLETYASQ